MRLIHLLQPFTPAVFQLLRSQRNRVVVGFGALVVVDLIDVTLPLVMKGAFDSIGKSDRFNWFALCYSGLLIVQAALRLTYRTLFPIAQCGFADTLRTTLARAMIGAQPHRAKRLDPGGAVTLLTSDTEQAACVLNDGVVIGTDAALYLILVPLLMLWVHPYVTPFVLIPLLAVPIIARRGERAITHATNAVQGALSQLSSFLDEKLRNHETILLFSLRERFTKRLEVLSVDMRQRIVTATEADARLTSSIQLCGALSMVILVVAGSVLIHRNTISIGGFVALYQYLQLLFWPLIALGLYISITQKAGVAGGRIDRVLRDEPNDLIEDRNGPIPEIPVVVLSEVSVFIPDSGDSIIRDISLTIRPGERIAFVGPTGSGKTTLLESIAGIRPSRGTISFLCGTLPVAAKDAVALCPQEPRLFADTIERNLIFWNRGAPGRDAMKEILHELFSEDEIRGTEEDSFALRQVDGRSGLSGGQRQRIALARTLLSSSPIMLLDNPFSALDPAREAQTIALLDRMVGNRTLIFATNRPAALTLANRIIVLVNGDIVEDCLSTNLENDRASWLARYVRDSQINGGTYHP